MTSKERYLATIRHELPDRLATDALGIANLDGIAAGWGVDVETARQRIGLDGRYVDADYIGPARVGPDGEPLSFWGTLAERYGPDRFYPLNPDMSVAQIERYAWPTTDQFDYAAAGRRAAELGPHYAVRVGGWYPLFCQACDLMGMEATLTTMLADEALFEAIVDRVFEFVYAHCLKMLETCGEHAAIFELADDFASQRGLMISPALWRRLLKPRYARLMELGHRFGKHVQMHSCGDVTAVLPDLLDIGLEIWQTVQLQTLPFSAAELKKRFGKTLTFFGGINSQRLPFWTPHEVRAEVVRCIHALGPGGGFIVSADHNIQRDVPLENLLALYETAHAFRGAGITGTQ